MFLASPLLAFVISPVTAADKNSADTAAAEKIIADWPERPLLGARQMIAQYGAPQIAVDAKLVWIDQGPYKRITVTKQEDHHDFPLPHMDYMEHTISYKVPAGKADELMKFDGSVTFDKTRGEMSARCDLEGHNILTLNLANDIVTGKTTAEEARVTFGETIGADMAGKYPPYTVKLQFEPQTMSKDSDKTSIPGAPVRSTKAKGDADPDVEKAAKAGGDAEILALCLAVDTNQVVAAMEVKKSEAKQAIKEYAAMLHKEHGKNAAATMKLGKEIDVTPTDTAKTNSIRVKGAGTLAALLAKDSEDFGAAYIDAMVTGHTEVLAMLDGELLKEVENEKLKAHLTEVRGHVAKHLDEAKEIQGANQGAGNN